MNEDMGCEKQQEMPTGIGIPIGKSFDSITDKLRVGAVDSLNAYLIRLLEKKDFCQARRIGDALSKLV